MARAAAWHGEGEPAEEGSGTRGNGDGPGGKLEAVSGRTAAGKAGGGAAELRRVGS